MQEHDFRLAVCPECGAMKRGVTTPCAQCGFCLDEDECYRIQLFLTDQFHSLAQLEEFAARIKAGETIDVPTQFHHQGAWNSEGVFDREIGPLAYAFMVLIVGLLATPLLLALARLWKGL